jgi:hypothetical protein
MSHTARADTGSKDTGVYAPPSLIFRRVNGCGVDHVLCQFSGGAAHPHQSRSCIQPTLSVHHNYPPVSDSGETKASASRGLSTKEGLQHEAPEVGHYLFRPAMSLSDRTGDGENRPSETSGEGFTGPPYQPTRWCKLLWTEVRMKFLPRFRPRVATGSIDSYAYQAADKLLDTRRLATLPREFCVQGIPGKVIDAPCGLCRSSAVTAFG